ncbi:MAG: hypothetical protein IT291_04000 [Deltaproteobacteria bacterium]|nr:hypothetical protein [Deltaproteobacteria bacterium]
MLQVKVANHWVVAILFELTAVVAPIGTTRTVAAEILSQSVAEVTSDRTSAYDSVSQLSRDGRHFDALAAFLERENEVEVNLPDRLAAARSAWALGHAEQARSIWDDILADSLLFTKDPATKYDVLLSRAIMELQERRYEEARVFAEKGAGELGPSDLRSQFWLVIAESLAEQGIGSQAEKYYRLAIGDGSDGSSDEARYLLGICQQRAGKLDEARKQFADIPLDSEFAPKALRRLIEVDYAKRDYEALMTWLMEAKRSYPAVLEDAWSAYVEVKALVETDKLEEARNALAQFKKRYSENDRWFVIAEATLNAELVRAAYAESPNGTATGMTPREATRSAK